ncbi:MAG: MBL fold metallo-hydrolase [Halodesulfurarchaeum sp.]
MPRTVPADVNTTEDPLRPNTLFEWIRRGIPVTILDVREESEYESWHVDGESVSAMNIPAYDFIEESTESILEQIPDDDLIVVVCAQGKSSALVAGWLESVGYDARNLDDGMDGWARVYEPFEVTAYDGPGTLLQFQRPSSGCLGYMLVKGDEAAVFDPLRAFTDRYFETAAEWGAELTLAVDTHIHADHVSGLRALLDRGVTGVLPSPAIERGVRYASDVVSVSDGDTLPVGSATVRVVHSPGHTTGMTAYFVDGQVLLTGDGLFLDSLARPDLEAGEAGASDAARTLYETIQKRILEMPPETIIAPGHVGDRTVRAPDETFTATLENLSDRMSLLTADEEEFVSKIVADMPPRPENYERIIETNLGREQVEDETAFDLELGPNNCASSSDALTSS